MRARIRQSFVAPVFEDEHKTRAAKLLNLILLTLLPLTVLGTLATIPLEPDEAFANLTFGVILTAIMLGARRLVMRGRLEVVSIVLSLMLWASFTYLAVSGNGVQDPSLTGYFLVIALAVLLLGSRAASVFGLLSILATVGMLLAEINGVATIATPESASLMDLFTLVTTLGLTALLSNYAVSSINEGFERARKNERAQIEANRKLQEAHALLEQRVAERTQVLARHSAQLQAAAEVGRSAASIRNLNQLLSRVVQLTSEHLGFYHVGIFLLDETGRYAELRAANSAGGQDMLAQGYRLAVGEQSIIGYATGVREPRIALDVGEGAARLDSSSLPNTRSEIALPLMAGDRLLGALDIQSDEQAAFSQEDLIVLQILTHQVAVAIENAYLFAENQAALEAERQAYSQLSSESWSQMIGGQADLGYLCNAQEVRPVSDAWQPEMIQASQAGQTVQNDGPTVAIPIKIRDQVTGVVRLRKPEGTGQWTTDELTLVEDLTRQLGLTLESARHYRETQRRALREQMTTEITARIRETLDIDTVLQTAIREIGDALDIAKAQVRMGIQTPPESTKIQEDTI